MTKESSTSQCNRMLRSLKKGSQTNSDFIDMNIYRYGSRIYDLRSRGHNIVTINEGDGCFRYQLRTGR